MLRLLDFNENPNVGVYCRANDQVVFLQRHLSKKIQQVIREALDAPIVELSVADANIIGSLLVLNSHGAVVAEFADKETIECLVKQKLAVYLLKDVINAAGNDILVNDHGVLVHPDMNKKEYKKIGEAFDAAVYTGTIGGLKTVGMAAVVTNNGCLCHPKTSEAEKQHLQDVFDVEVMIGTVNHGFPLIGSGIVANTHGAIIGNQTTGVELNRIEEALGFLN